MHLIPLVDPSTFRSYNESFRRRRRVLYNHAYPSHDLPNLDGDIASLMTSSQGVHTIWASAASPHIDSTMFAVGDSKGTLLVRLTGDGVSDVGGQREWCGNEQAAETLAVDFWKPDLVLSGMRSGKVRLWDIRSKGTNIRFQHPSCISNIRAIDDNKVLVAGLAAKMAIYDTRFTKGYPQSHQGGDIEASVPLQVFSSYRSGSYFYPRLGFDIHLGMGLIASATEDKSLQIFSWKSGKQELDVGPKGNAHLNASKHKSMAGSAKFTRVGPNGNVPRSLFINSAASSAENAHGDAPYIGTTTSYLDTSESAQVGSHCHTARSPHTDAGNQREQPDRTLDGPIRCVKFVEDQQGGDGLRLLVANGTKIDAWAW
ncbi:MAG: hypothetical protein L6R38_000443 [Xanthoria sp. 2 TBL-2021]|nr:MAG: hypothetical protein L6R38_000443 [Xanthoria sp. 2 TBL-2021]